MTALRWNTLIPILTIIIQNWSITLAPERWLTKMYCQNSCVHHSWYRQSPKRMWRRFDEMIPILTITIFSQNRLIAKTLLAPFKLITLAKQLCSIEPSRSKKVLQINKLMWRRFDGTIINMDCNYYNPNWSINSSLL